MKWKIKSTTEQILIKATNQGQFIKQGDLFIISTIVI